MRSFFLASVVAGLAFTAAAARADEVVYPDQQKVFATRLDDEPIVTSDATFLGPHAVVVKDSTGPDRAAVATSEDAIYLTNDPLPIKTAPLCAPARDERVAQADCPHRG